MFCKVVDILPKVSPFQLEPQQNPWFFQNSWNIKFETFFIEILCWVVCTQTVHLPFFHFVMILCWAVWKGTVCWPSFGCWIFTLLGCFKICVIVWWFVYLFETRVSFKTRTNLYCLVHPVCVQSYRLPAVWK